MSTRKTTAFALILGIFAAMVGTFALSAPVSAAGPKCWQVDCNTCCRGTHGVICTQRACA